jgi:outer membrane lipoprotein-sorting protein
MQKLPAMVRVNDPPRRLVGMVLAGAILLWSSAPVVAADTDPTTLWHRSLAAQRFSDLRADATLTTTFRSGDQVALQMKLLAVLQPDGVSRMALTRVTGGGAFVQTAFLSVEHPKAADDLWIYLPAVGSPRRLVSSNLGDSYLGSEFRYGDLVQPDPDEYVVTLRGEETIEGEPCWVLEAVPRDEKLVRDSGLGRQVLWLRQKGLAERKVEQYDRRGTLLKVIDLPRLFTDPATGKVFAVERQVRNVRSGAQSVALFENVTVNANIPADLFSPARLADRSW